MCSCYWYCVFVCVSSFVRVHSIVCGVGAGACVPLRMHNPNVHVLNKRVLGIVVTFVCYTPPTTLERLWKMRCCARSITVLRKQYYEGTILDMQAKYAEACKAQGRVALGVSKFRSARPRNVLKMTISARQVWVLQPHAACFCLLCGGGCGYGQYVCVISKLVE